MSAYKIRLKKGDMAIVRVGKFKGRTAKVLATHPHTNQVTLEGINVVTRHRKPTQANPGVSSFEITRPLLVSKVAYYDSTAKKGGRLGYRLTKNGDKSRLLKSSGKEIK